VTQSAAPESSRGTLRVIGRGRAGGALSLGLERAGWMVRPSLGRGDDLSAAAEGVDLLVIATPDGSVSEVAGAVTPVAETLVVHLSGSLGPAALGAHSRRGALHPLVALPDAKTGARRITAGVWFAVAGDPAVHDLVADLGGQAIQVADEDRALYHAAATIASNHLVALLGQVERVAGSAGVPFAAYLDLVRATVENVAELGPAAALTGAVKRGDWDTVATHLTALPETEHRAYEAMVGEAARLAAVQPAFSNASALAEFDSVGVLRKALGAERANGRSIGLVPTMGYLHAGHAALIRRAAEECDAVLLSIFVNPLQFGPSEDLDSYPRDLERDRHIAETAGARFLFVPSRDEMWPGGAPAVSVSAGPLGNVLDGASRPGHFDGVATVVAKLFAIAGECRAYFGEKDFQQLQVIRRMVSDLALPVDVVGCPTVREVDGLAMSSRNAYLTAEERAVAPQLHRALQAGRDALLAGQTDPAEVSAAMIEVVSAEPAFDLDYAVAVQAADLSTPAQLHDEVRLLIAARLGRARLIDNLGVNL
jgi:pantoate--beta-alanine ligase